MAVPWRGEMGIELNRWSSGQRLFLMFLSLVLAGSSLFAGGPLLSAPGDAFRWDRNRPVPFAIDPGPLRSGTPSIDNAAGVELVENAFATWGGIASADLQFENTGALDADVTVDNALDILFGDAPGNSIIFDADGEIVELLFGEGAAVLGFASSIDANGDGLLDSGFAVLSGPLIDPENLDAFIATLIHEIGHLLGLDHTQVGLAAFNQCNPDEPDPCLQIPIMFPVGLAGVPSVTEPLADDRAWFSWLYPAVDFGASTGTIRGHVMRRSGFAFQGANVVALPVIAAPAGGTPVLDETNAISNVSDFLFRFTGEFEIPGLAAGQYVLRVEPLMEDFVAGSGVGPYDDRYVDFPVDFFNGDNESGGASDDPMEQTIIEVAAGQTVNNITFVSNDMDDAIPGNDLSTLGDDDSRGVLFPAGFLFPYFGVNYRGVFVNSDGNLTFGAPDGDSFDASGALVSRDEARFLAGPPRIAPLYSDLNPSAGGSVELEVTEEMVRVVWNSVPEFGASPSTGNTFSVTLTPDGRIEQVHETLAVTPTTGLDNGLTAVVGVTPGGRAGTATDLSSLGQPIALNVEPIYEVFTNLPDLSGSLDFQGQLLVRQLLFPFYSGDAATFTGFAVTNASRDNTDLEFEARAGDGTLQTYPDNPSPVALDSGKQIALLGNQLFGLPFSAVQDGWVRLSSQGEDLASFFLFGNGLSGRVSRLDGSVASMEASNVLYFTRIFNGAGSFPVGQDALTRLALANPGEAAVTVTLRRFNASGNQIGGAVIRNLPANGCLLETIDDLFGAATQISGEGFIQADIDGDGAIGFELVELADTLLGFNAATENAAATAFSAQLANGASIFTSVKVVNVDTVTRTLTLTAIDSDGSTISTFGPLQLASGESIQRDVTQLFSLGPGSTEGSLRVVADGPGIIGDVIFGHPSNGSYAAALPLQTELLSRAIFSQVANSQNASASRRTFTGLAFFNPDAEEARIRIRVFTEECFEAGATELVLGPDERTAELLQDLIPATAGQIRGFILVESSRPVVAQQLFGNFTLDYLSAVPPIVLK